MNKSQKMKKATRNTRKQNKKQWFKKIILFPWKVCKKVWSWTVAACKFVWRLLCRIFSAIWNWLKSIDIIGMINLTLLVAIIVLFSSLIADFVCCNKCSKSNVNKSNVVAVSKNTDSRKVVQRKFSTNLPVKVDAQTNIKPKIKTIGLKKPQVIRELSVPANELKPQNLSGDVIVDVHPSAPTLQNGVYINGNLFIQNVNKYTLPCGATINGNLFVRNVARLNFCGDFTVKGNIYVNRESSFGPIPDNARIDGNVIL